MQGIVGDDEFDADFFSKPLVEASEQCASSGKVYAVSDDVGIEFGRRILQRA